MRCHLSPIAARCLLLLGVSASVALTPAGATPELRRALTFHASFDRTADADFARGDGRMYTAEDRRQRDTAMAGLPGTGQVRLAAGEGRFGGALKFKEAISQQIFFRGPENLGYRPRQWIGSLSFWLRLDPDEDLLAGRYSDPVQLTAQQWTEGSMFVEFSKDHTPRHFRFVIMAVKKFWNPDDRKYEEIPEAERPMAAIHQPPFRRDRWTHVLVTFANINTGVKDGRGTLYLDGKRIGSFTGWNNTFNWEPDKSVLTLGVNYVGLIDDVAVFDRELTDEEVRAVYALPHGIGALR